MAPSRLPLLLVAAAALVAGCEDTVDPTLGIDAPFSLYGYLDPTADRQAIRVVPIADRIDAPADSLDAAVTTTDLETGETHVWRDSLVTFADGTQGHVFVADYTPRPGATVRMDARRADGVAATVEVEVPPLVTADLQALQTSPGELIYPIRFEGAPRLLSGQLELIVSNYNGVPGALGQLTVPLTVRPTEVSPDVWAVDIPFLSAADRFMRAQGLRDTGLELLRVSYSGFVTNEAWNPPSDDLDALVEPGTFTNVVGGLGFVGSGYFARAVWEPSLVAQASLGFDVRGGAGSYVVINEVQAGLGGWVEFYNPLYTPATLNRHTLSSIQQSPDVQVLGPDAVVPARGFLVVSLDFNTVEDSNIWFQDDDGEVIQRYYIEDTAAGLTYGSYPDGRSFFVPQVGPDIFRGLMPPTPGAPNRLRHTPAVLNEIASEGADGWVEIAYAPGFTISAAFVMSAENAYSNGRSASAGTAGPFGTAQENGEGLVLPQEGGEVLLLLGYAPSDGSEPGEFRVVDVHTFGVQTPGRSVGRLPDGPEGNWRPGLRPTRGAPNSLARLDL